MYLAIATQLLTGLIALALLWKDWPELKKKSRYLPVLTLLATLLLTVFSIGLVVKGIRDADRIEANHKGEAQQFDSTLTTLLDRLGKLQQQVNTEPLLKQNQQLQQDLTDTKRLMQATKDQLSKPAPKATLEAMFATMAVDIPKKQKEITASMESGHVDFTIRLQNTSDVPAKNGSVIVRLCNQCKFFEEPERFHKIIGTADYDREMNFDLIPAGLSTAIPLKVAVTANLGLNAHGGISVEVVSRCENCVVTPLDKLEVHF